VFPVRYELKFYIVLLFSDSSFFKWLIFTAMRNSDLIQANITLCKLVYFFIPKINFRAMRIVS
jgi:hypothetical protein